MLKYIIKKYYKVALFALLFFFMGYQTEPTFDNGMTTMVCFGIFFWLGAIIYHAVKGHGQKVVSMATGLTNLLLLGWYIISLKPLRMLVRRMRYGAFSAPPYPYLALYGSIVDTYAMKGKFNYGLVNSKSPVARAALWRLLSRGCIGFGSDGNGHIGLRLGEWKSEPHAGLDQQFEQSVFDLMKAAARPDGTLRPQDVIKAVGSSSGLFKPLFQFADLLNTNISLKAYSKEDVRNIFGMKRFLQQLPSSYENATFDKGALELLKIWPEYMTYAYLFGIEDSTLQKLSTLLPSDQNTWSPLQYLLTTSHAHRQVLNKMMSAIGEAAPAVEDIVAGQMGRFTFAWHVDEIYDI